MMLAQFADTGSDSAAVLGVLFALVLLGLQVFLIVKFVQAANDIAALRQMVSDWFDAYLDIDEEEEDNDEGEDLAVAEVPPAEGEWNASQMSGTGKVCPDCAETIRPEARVCRFCGYRFEDPT
jgi:hypothetical protein